MVLTLRTGKAEGIRPIVPRVAQRGVTTVCRGDLPDAALPVAPAI